jgi:hypothetical protein
VVNLSMCLFPRLRRGFIPIAAPVQGQFVQGYSAAPASMASMSASESPK